MTATSVSSSSVLPVRDRITTLDFIRGAALFGILISIVDGYNSSLVFGSELHPPSSPADESLGFWLTLVINRRFISLLSLLFGVGLAIQQQNFAARGEPFTGYFLRRMGTLALLGIINTTFFFWTEILLVYAVFGTVVYLLSRWPRGVLLALAGFAALVWGSLYEVVGRPGWIERFSWFPQDYSAEQLRQVYTEGPLWAAAKLRWIEYGTIYADNGFHLGLSFAMILLGYLAGTGGWHRKFIADHRACATPFTVALLYTLAFGLFALSQGRPDFLITDGFGAAVFYELFVLSTIFVYLYLLVAFSRTVGPDHPVHRAIARNGRLSLSGYMGGAGVYALVFYYPGLGLYTQWTRPRQTLFAVAVYAAFTVFSWAWLSRFRFGPVEWIFRRLSYRRRLG